VYFDGDLGEVAFSDAAADWYQILLSLRGKTSAGEDLEIIIHQNRIDVTLCKSYAFGAAIVLVERTNNAADEKYTTSIKVGDQMVATFESTVKPDDSVAGKLVIQAAEGKVTLNLSAGTYTAEQPVFSETYGKELLKQSTSKLVGDQLLNIYEILIDPATGKIPQRIRRDYASGGVVPVAEFITRQAANGDEVSMTRFYNRAKGAWGNYSGTLRRNGGKRYMLTSTKPILTELSSGLMRQVEATLRDSQSGKTAAVSVVFSKGSLMIDSCPAQWGNLTLCSAV
jgi:hypothetical protein